MLPETLQAIRDLAQSQPDFKQSAIINRLLTALFQCADDDTLWRMLSEEHAYEKGFIVTWCQDAATLRERAKNLQSPSY